jgi:hypothetical protein
MLYYTSRMSMGKRKRDRQATMWVATTDLPTAPSHPFYRRLNQLLREHGFDDATTAIAGGVAVRRKTDGQELERAGVVYLMQKTGAGWQIATIVIHDADDALRPA